VNNPIKRLDDGLPGLLATTPPPVARQHILLVEDHIDTAFLMRIILERNGFTVTVAHTMHDAVLNAATEPPDLLVSDIMLPDGTGWDLLAALKPILSVKSIAVSALSSREDVRRSALAGFDRHITKPVRADLLCATITEVLQEGRSTETGNGKNMSDGGSSLKLN
jgi:DNA-binding response OmpR family regulator